MKQSFRLAFFSTALVVSLVFSSITDDVIERSLYLSVSVFSIAFALQSLATIGLGKDHE